MTDPVGSHMVQSPGVLSKYKQPTWMFNQWGKELQLIYRLHTDLLLVMIPISVNCLPYYGWNKMATILQRVISCAFPWNKFLYFDWLIIGYGNGLVLSGWATQNSRPRPILTRQKKSGLTDFLASKIHTADGSNKAYLIILNINHNLYL